MKKIIAIIILMMSFATQAELVKFELYGKEYQADRTKLDPTIRNSTYEAFAKNFAKIFNKEEKVKLKGKEVDKRVQIELRKRMKMYEQSVFNMLNMVKINQKVENSDVVEFDLGENVAANTYKDIKKKYPSVERAEFDKAHQYYLEYSTLLLVSDILKLK